MKDKTIDLINTRIDALNSYVNIDREKTLDVLIEARLRIERLEACINVMIDQVKRGELSGATVYNAEEVVNEAG